MPQPDPSPKLHRTAHYSPEQLEHLRSAATRQERTIARWFWKHPRKAIGPSALHNILSPDWPLTSTRRAITNLTDAGVLIKTDRTATGEFGRPEHLWKWRERYNIPQPEQGQLFEEVKRSRAYDR